MTTSDDNRAVRFDPVVAGVGAGLAEMLRRKPSPIEENAKKWERPGDLSGRAMGLHCWSPPRWSVSPPLRRPRSTLGATPRRAIRRRLTSPTGPSGTGSVICEAFRRSP
jgi:hypothetical protein